LVSTALLRDVGGFDPDLRHYADWLLWIQLAQRGLPACVGDVVVAYRLHPGNDHLHARHLVAELPDFQRRAGGNVEVASVLRWAATTSLQQQQWGNAARWLVRAAALDPDVPSLRRDARRVAGGLRRRLRSEAPGPRRRLDPRSDPWLAAAEGWLAPLRAA
jgi:hypothetical protein